jgi:aspartate racemase
MQRIGLLGGMSWESTQIYYRLINERVRAARGGLSSAPLLVLSVDFAPMAAMQAADDWPGLAKLMAGYGLDLKNAGACAIAIASNTMHKVADAVADATGLPILHVADALTAALHAAGVKKALLLGTRFAMEEDFYRNRLVAAGIDILIPSAPQREIVHRVIFEELCRGHILDPSRCAYQAIIEDARSNGAEAVILGCTEIGLLIGQDDSALPLFDTATLHADAIAAACLES